MSTSRRAFLRAFASVPLAFSFGLALSPLGRYLKPTTKPMDFFGPSDQPVTLDVVRFDESQLKEDWQCLTFDFLQSTPVYNPEEKETRKIPGYIVRLPNGDIHAYSRICPHLGCVFQFVKDPDECAKKFHYRPEGPVFACPCHLSVYDIAQNGKVVSGPAPRPPYRFEMERSDGKITITELERGNIA
jgi:Rieske Fe-S protein